MPYPLYTYILNIYDLVGWVLWHINIVGYLMSNLLKTHILDMYDLV